MKKLNRKIYFQILLMLVTCLSVLSGCRKNIDRIKTVDYIYKNTSGKDLQLLVYNPDKKLIKTFNIPDGDEIITHTTMDEGIGIFQFANNENQLGDSISVRFADNRCISYLRSVPDKIFDVKQYDNYSKELLEQGRFSLIYSITAEDYDGAGECGR